MDRNTVVTEDKLIFIGISVPNKELINIDRKKNSVRNRETDSVKDEQREIERQTIGKKEIE